MKEKKEIGDISIDFSEPISRAYQTNPNSIEIDISETHYSNLAYVMVSGRDVCIDFLMTPGVCKNNVPVLKGIRLYMAHSSAMRLAEVIKNSIEKQENEEKIEPINGDKK